MFIFRELENRGLCVRNMNVAEVETGLYGKVLVRFEHNFANALKKSSSSKISNGDIVAITDENTQRS